MPVSFTTGSENKSRVILHIKALGISISLGILGSPPINS